MSAMLLTPPAVEPWTIAEAKTFLRVGTSDDDAVIGSLIAAARGQIEALARCVLITQTWRVTLDEWPRDGRIRVRLSPLRDVAAARLRDEAGNAIAIDAERFLAGESVVHAPSWSLPAPLRARGGIELDVIAGFGNSPSDVPDVLRHAVRTLVAHWYDNRGLAAIGGTVALLPGTVNAMIASYRTLSL